MFRKKQKGIKDVEIVANAKNPRLLQFFRVASLTASDSRLVMIVAEAQSEERQLTPVQ